MNAVQATLDHSVIFKVIASAYLDTYGQITTFGTSVISKSAVTVGSSIGVIIGGVIGAVIFIIIFTLFVVLAVVIAMKWREDKEGTRSQGILYSSLTTTKIIYGYITCF